MFLSALTILLGLVSNLCFAELKIPKNLTSNDRQTILESLGYGTASKLLGDPFPLGGFSGFEVGMTSEVINTSDIAQLGARAPSQSETGFSTLTLGKGLYSNVDFYAQFSFAGNSEQISNFGSQLRWGFYQAEYLPIYSTLILHANSSNFQNKISTNTQGLDLVMGFNVDDVTVYFGAGMLRAQGVFIGGNNNGANSPAITDQNFPNGQTDPVDGTPLRQTMQESVGDTRYIAGINLKFSKMFIAMEIDRVNQSTYSAKLGLRY